ncbi:MAG: O-antigen ligase family protein [Bacteroidales bacterium]|jgi:O-antigen ligase|nr:O-antigen ligase family protein [Bacteroidales bacterium]
MVVKAKITITEYTTGALLLALFLTVCITDPALWRGMITAKYFHFTTVICFAVPVAGYLLVRRKWSFPLMRIADVATALFVSYVIVHRMVMGGGRDMQWWLFLLMIPFYAFIRAFFENRNGIRTLTTVILIMMLIETLWGILQLCGVLPSFHKSFRVTGSLFNPGPYAGFVATGIPPACGQLFSRNTLRWERMLGVAVLLGSLVVLPFTGSRAAWLSALTGIAVAVWCGYAGRKLNSLPVSTRRRRRAVVVAVLIIPATVMLYGMYHMKKDSADGRRLIWKVSASMVKEHPLSGTGTGRFAAVYGQAQADYFLSGKGTEAQAMVADHPGYAFNELIHIAVELGIPGLALFLLMVISALLSGYRPELFGKHLFISGEETASLGKISVASGGKYYQAAIPTFLVFATFSYPFDVLPLACLFVAFLAVAASQTPPLRRQPAFRWHAAGWLAVLLLTVTVTFRVLPRRQSYRDWQEAHLLFRSGAYRDALDEYLFLYERLKYEKIFLMEYARCLSHLGQYERSNRVFTEYLAAGCNPEAYNYMGNNHKALGQYDAAEQAYIRSSLIAPNRHYPEYLLMKLYYDTGRMGQAVEKALILMDKPVKVSSQVIRLIRQEAGKILEIYNNTPKSES